MKINTSQVEMVLMNKAIPANLLEREIGISRSAITRIRNGERKIENLTLDTIVKVQQWIDEGNYRFSYDYSELIEELEEDIAEGLTDDYIYIVRGEYNEVMEKCMIVKDEGQGILPEDLEKIFNRLYRVETSRNMKTGGHGLGLAIARELAHQLGGEITAESQHGLGSTFTFHLNLK